MAGRLTGKVAVITGSTSGIGRATAKRFAQEGALVVVSGRRRELGETAVAEIRQAGGEAIYVEANVGRTDDLKGLIREAVSTYGRLDILMNNAFSGKSGSVVEMSEADWDAHLDVSLKAVFLGCKYAVPEMLKVGGGVIINTSSIHGVLAGPSKFFGSIAYESAKAAVINLTRQVAVEYGPSNIRANAICPGRILTESKVEWLQQNPEIDARDRLLYPLRRFGETDEVAKVAVFLASDDSSFVTGQAIVVDGGLTAQLPDAVGVLMWEEYAGKG